ncbi:tRNA dihydrouridine synthase DusB [Simiduia sp. 21SJ11W-1]|uniref:tRNA dihydrouridine synthase DusB n=1 Tax=Simiduia sp. 21SJ11W-1 TaxID=2909669 RepID=UPI0021126DE4|nr:tRNA dihydrouridine synthase DusB [Simiduia sp. 21SJ11W-1]
MAGVTDLPFRKLCLRFGAGLAASEMVTSDVRLWNSRKSSLRLAHDDEASPRAVQIAGGDPEMMVQAARLNVANGAEIIDINMGCPAKKVCKKAAGSALLANEPLVQEILHAVVAAVDVPVTLKIRTGSDIAHRNGVRIAQMAEQAGIQALAVHGRTRACAFKGSAEYDTIAEIVQAVSIPVLANGDINSATEARQVLEYTGAQAVMIGRAAQGRPWIFQEINHYLRTGQQLPAPGLDTIEQLLCEHIGALATFYGDVMGPRIARKHVGWYLKTLPGSEAFRKTFNKLECAKQQHASIQTYFEMLRLNEEKAA